MGFTAYLTQAIHNHFANFCRTRSRKYRDTLLSGQAVLKHLGGGAYALTGQDPEGSDWMAGLSALDVSDDDVLALVNEVEEEFEFQGVALRDENGAVSERGGAVLDRVAAGQDLELAIQEELKREQRKANAERRERRRSSKV